MLQKIQNNLLGFFDKKNSVPFIAVDIGASSIKVLSLDLSGDKPKILGIGATPTPANCLTHAGVSKPEQVGNVLKTLIETNEIKGTKAIFALPASLVFSKKVTIPDTPIKMLDETISFEAGNYIPHSIDAVHLDYQVVGNEGKNMELLIVAVKNEVIESYKQTLEIAGLIPAIADVDSFALENMFELSYPEEKNKTVALINIGARSTVVSICQGGQSLITGDIGAGGRLYTDALCEACGMQPSQAEMAKTGRKVEGFDETLILEARDKTTEHLASEIHRQLGFLWNAAGTDRTIEAIYASGGTAQIPGLIEDLGARTGIPCHRTMPFRNIERPDDLDEVLLNELGTGMSIGVGLAIRRLADKQHQV